MQSYSDLGEHLPKGDQNEHGEYGDNTLRQLRARLRREGLLKKKTCFGRIRAVFSAMASPGNYKVVIERVSGPEFHRRVAAAEAAKVAADLKAARGDPQRLRALLDRRSPAGYTSLHEAARWGHEDAARLLLEAGADGNAQTTGGGDGWTALHLCAYPDSSCVYSGHEGVARLLLEEAGADPDARDDLGMAPLHHAAKEGHEVIARLLLEAGADRDAQSESGRTPLHLAALFGREAVAQLLLDAGADKDTRDNNGATPLALAMEPHPWLRQHEWGHEAVARLLGNAGGGKNARDNKGATPFSSAAAAASTTELVPYVTVVHRKWCGCC